MSRYKIDESPHSRQVEDMLKSGGSIRQVSDYLKNQEGFSVSPASVLSFKNRHRIGEKDKAESRRKAGPLESRLEGIDCDCDEAVYMKKLLMVQLQRIDESLSTGEIDDKREQAIDRQVDMARKIIMDLVKMKLDLSGANGDNQGEGGRLNPYEQAAVQGRPSLGEVLRLVGAGERQQVIRAVEEALMGVSCSDGTGVSVVVGKGESEA